MWSGINRRKFPRANYPCKISVKKKDDPNNFSTETENIGVGGICVVIERDLGIFAPVQIRLDLLDGQPIVECEGTIVWIVRKKDTDTNFYDTGIEFTNIKRQDADRINFIIEKIKQK